MQSGNSTAPHLAKERLACIYFVCLLEFVHTSKVPQQCLVGVFVGGMFVDWIM